MTSKSVTARTYQRVYTGPPLREDTHKKKVGFLVVGPLRGEGEGNPPPRPLSKKTLFFYKWRKFTGKLHNENIIL